MNTVNQANCPYDLSTDLLKTGSIFGALSPSSIQFLIESGSLMLVGKDERIFSDHDKGDSFFIVLDGEVGYYRENQCAETSNTTLIRRVSFGEAVGYVTMISLAPRSGYAIAESDALLLEINYQVFGDFHDKYPFDFGILILNLSRDMARNIQKLSKTLGQACISVDLTN